MDAGSNPARSTILFTVLINYSGAVTVRKDAATLASELQSELAASICSL